MITKITTKAAMMDKIKMTRDRSWKKRRRVAPGAEDDMENERGLVTSIKLAYERETADGATDGFIPTVAES